MKTTDTLSLKKPELTDSPDITVISDDMDLIDTAIDRRVKAYVGSSDGLLHYKYPLVEE